MLSRIGSSNGVAGPTYEFSLIADTKGVAKISDPSQDILFFGSGSIFTPKVFSQIVLSVSDG